MSTYCGLDGTESLMRQVHQAVDMHECMSWQADIKFLAHGCQTLSATCALLVQLVDTVLAPAVAAADQNAQQPAMKGQSTGRQTPSQRTVAIPWSYYSGILGTTLQHGPWGVGGLTWQNASLCCA